MLLILNKMAVRVGFEPTEESPPQRFSRPPDSTTLAPHRLGYESAPSISKGFAARAELALRQDTENCITNSSPTYLARLPRGATGAPNRFTAV